MEIGSLFTNSRIASFIFSLISIMEFLFVDFFLSKIEFSEMMKNSFVFLREKVDESCWKLKSRSISTSTSAAYKYSLCFLYNAGG